VSPCLHSLNFLCFICKFHSAHHVLLFLFSDRTFLSRFMIHVFVYSPSHNPLWSGFTSVNVRFIDQLFNKALILTIISIFIFLLLKVFQNKRKILWISFCHLFLFLCVCVCVMNWSFSDRLKATENSWRFRL